MKIIEKCKIHIVGSQSIEWDGIGDFLNSNGVEWESDTDNPSDFLMETAGRLCYMSFENPRPGGNKAYIDHIKKVGHGSVIEHSVWNFIVEGVSRSFSHELVRHRAGMAYSQLSQRYVDESVAEYILPPDIQKDTRAYEIWEDAILHSHNSYIELSNLLFERFSSRSNPEEKLNKTEIRKKARSAARSVLPNATETKIFVTANGRAIRHILEMRGSRHADSEIRNFAIELLRQMQIESPTLFGDYKIVDGEIITDYRKI